MLFTLPWPSYCLRTILILIKKDISVFYFMIYTGRNEKNRTCDKSAENRLKISKHSAIIGQTLKVTWIRQSDLCPTCLKLRNSESHKWHSILSVKNADFWRFVANTWSLTLKRDLITFFNFRVEFDHFIQSRSLLKA